MKLVIAVILFGVILGSEIICPGGRRQCPDGATCCQLPSREYGCCPLPNAVCCNDHIHCCPYGSRCDAGMCTHLYDSGNVTTTNGQSFNTVCPGGKYVCPEDSTCCKDSLSNIYNCCLLPNAVCCASGDLCCPQHTTCDLESRSCFKKEYKTEMYDTTKTKGRLVDGISRPALLVAHPNDLEAPLTQFNSVICPHSSYLCPDGYTCCQLPNEKWGCCPFQNAVCCPDHLHCCPSGLKCDLTSAACVHGQNNVTWSNTILAQKITVGED